MKGIWLPIQSVAGYPNWPDFAAAEASAADQALMCVYMQVLVPFARFWSHPYAFFRLARCGVTDIFVDVWNNGAAPYCAPLVA